MTSFTVDPVAPARFSMSFLRAAEGCLRRAHLDRMGRVPLDGDALVGTLFHECVATICFACSMRGQTAPSVDEAVALARKTLQRPERPGPMPRQAHATVLWLVERWARSPSAEIRDGEIFEVLSVLPLAGRLLSARLDRYWRHDHELEIVDYKTGWSDPAHELTLQGEIYAWHGFEREPGIDVVLYSERHERAGVTAGPFDITRDDVYGRDGIVDFLIDAIARVDDAYARGTLPPSPGSSCSTPSRCPHANTCPIPEWARPDTTVTTHEEALELFGSLLVQEQRQVAEKLAIRGWLSSVGWRALKLYGQEIGMGDKPSETLDKARLAKDLAAGQEVTDLAPYTKLSNPSFGRRKARP